MSIFSSKTRTATAVASKSAGYAARSAGNDLRRAQDDVMDSANDLRQDLSRSAYKAERRVRAFANDVYGDIEGTATHLANEVRANPIKSVLLLLAAGLVLGSLYSSRRD